MFVNKCIYILLVITCNIMGTPTLEIRVNQRGNGILGGNETEIICLFTTDPKIDIQFVVYTLSATNLTTNTFDQIAVFTSKPDTNLQPSGEYLRGRVKLNISLTSTNSGQATMSFQYLTCDDEKEYKCDLVISNSGPPLIAVATGNISVQASPLKPETVSQLNSSLEEGQDVAFKCGGNVGKPPGRYIWQKIRKKNSELATYENVTTVSTQSPNSCTYNGTSILSIALTAEDNQAIIRCAEKSMASLYKDSEPLNVLYKVRKPTITKDPNKTNYIVGSGDIELKCYADGNPQSKYTWLKDDNRDMILSSNASLVIDSKNATNSGTYICHAFNSLNGKNYNASQSVNISIVYDIPTSTSTVPTNISSTVILTSNKGFCEQDYCKIGFGVGGGAVIGLVIAIILGIARSRRKKFEKFHETDNLSSRTNTPSGKTGSRSASRNGGYEDTEDLPMSSMKKEDTNGKSVNENKTFNYVEVDFVDDKASNMAKDTKPVHERPVNKKPNETVYSVVQKTKSVGNTNERMFNEEKNNLKRDEDDPYADNKELYDHLGSRRHKPNTADEIFDHQQRSVVTKDSMKF